MIIVTEINCVFVALFSPLLSFCCSSGYLLFIKELKPSLRDVRPNELFREYGRRWAELSQEEKSEYADKVKDVKRKYEEKLAAFKAVTLHFKT